MITLLTGRSIRKVGTPPISPSPKLRASVFGLAHFSRLAWFAGRSAIDRMFTIKFEQTNVPLVDIISDLQTEGYSRDIDYEIHKSGVNQYTFDFSKCVARTSETIESIELKMLMSSLLYHRVIR